MKLKPNAANAQRLSTPVRLLANAGVTARAALSPRFVREPLNDGEPSLLELLAADSLDEQRVAELVKEAKALEDAAEDDRLARDARLAALGFEEPSDERRRAASRENQSGRFTTRAPRTRACTAAKTRSRLRRWLETVRGDPEGVENAHMGIVLSAQWHRLAP